jgi:hypothetical protein
MAQNACEHFNQRNNLYKVHPELKPENNDMHEYLENFTLQYSNNKATKSASNMVIPLVFHVVHNNGEENISDAQIFESIVQLNEDYAAVNPELVEVHPSFTDLVADVGMEFRLAELDPNGEPTTGINRIQSDLTYNGSNIALKEMIQWDPTMYLNIWVVYSSDGGNGSAFAYYPADVEGSGSIYDGVVSSYWAVGRTETAVWTHYKILTHEVGHWANLKHTWGDQSNNQALAGCSYDDAVDDTPNTIGNSGCDLEAVSCETQDNVQNYMDYGNCTNMFTLGQKTRMLAALNSDVGGRNNLWSATNHELVFIQEDYLPRIVYNAQSFSESYANDGSIDSQIEIELIDLAFASTGALVEDVDFTTNNLPIGTSISVSATDATHAQINMSGTVMNHLEADALDNIEIHFTANPFAAVTYEEIYNPSKTNIVLTFMDPYEIVFVDIVDDVHNFFEGQQWKWFSMGTGGADFGLFHYDLINIKLETYGNGAVCNSGTTNISPLEIGVEVGPESDITNPGSYPGQLDLSNPSYTEWNGQTAYAGVEFQKNGNNHYGWVRLKVSADGKHYYALDMAYNETPEASILTGQVQEPVLAYSQTVFNESVANDGSIESQRVIDVFGATWSDFVSVTEGDGFTLSNVPTGLSAQFEKLSETSATISLNGTANDHSNSSDHNYMSLSIDESILDATSPVQSLTEIFSIDFNDHYEIEYVNSSESEIISVANPGNDWTWFSLDVGDAEYGLWHVNEYFRLETYAKSGVCNAGTTDLAVLQEGDIISDASYWDYFTELETQLVVTSPDYSDWNGQTAYVGIKFTIADRFHYGWMQFEVSDAGDAVTLIDYAYNTNPGEEILAGQQFATYGCTDSTALNYNPIAIDDNGTCEYPLDCGEDVYMSLSTYDTYGDGWNNNYLTILNSSGVELESFTMNSGSEASYEFCLAPDCYQYSVGGGSWTSEISWEVYMDYELLVEGVGDGFGLISVGGDCSTFIGCTDELAFNYNPDAIEEDGSCTYPVMGCTSAEALNYNSEAEEDDGSCYYDYDVLGCNDPFALNFNSSATYNDGTCEYSGLSLIDVPTVLCLGEPVLITWTGANPAVTVSISLSNVTENTTVSTIATIVNSGEFLWEVQGITEGSTDTYRFYIQEVPWPPTSYSYGSHFTILDDCNNIVYGCTDSFALNYDVDATIDDGSCTYPLAGCTDESALNYNPEATEDDGSCTYPIDCDGLTAVTIEVGGGSWSYEVSWSVGGFIGGEGVLEACLEDGCHTFNMADSYGDGWNGNVATITTSNGDVIFTGTLESGSEGLLGFGLNTEEDCGEVVETIDCGTQNVLSIHMQDSYGDGWNDAQLTFYDNSNTESAVLTLENGSDAAMQFCLADGCYTYVVSSGAYPEEISWQINFDDTEVLTGIAPDEGSFALNSEDCTDIVIPVFGCTDAAAINYNTEATDDDGSCEYPMGPSEQVLSLPPGWSMLSMYMIAESMDMVDIIAPIFDNIIIIKNNAGLAYLTAWEFNGIGDALVGQGYQIKTDAAVEFTVAGQYAFPEDNPINLTAGWNMIGYLRTEPADAMAVMANIWANGENLVIAKDYQGNAYLPAWGFNGIGDMNPGEGYQLKVNNDDVLNYLSNDESYRLAEMEIVENNVAHFSKVALTDNNMTVVIEDAAWDVLPTEGSELAAFDKAGNLIGSAIYSSPVTVLTVWGDDATTSSKDGLEVSEVISFKVWTAGTVRDFTVTVWAEGSASYNVDAINVASTIESNNVVTELNSSDRVLVRVINVLGQEVNSNDDTFKGEVLFKVYDDGTVEKFVN